VLGLAVAALALIGAACLPPAPPPPAPAQLSITPGSESFSDYFPGAASPIATFVVKNVGAQTSGVLGDPETLLAGEFFASNGTCDAGDGRLSPNETCEISVAFDADSGGGVVVNGQVQISASPGGTATADLSGTELDATPLSVSFTTLSFPESNVPGGTTNGFVVNNLSDFDATGVDVSLTNLAGPGLWEITNNTCGTTIVAHDACSVQVTYTNDDGDGDTSTADLVASALAADPVVKNLDGTAGGTPNILGVNSATLGMEDPVAGDATPGNTATITVTNVGFVTTGALTTAFVDAAGGGVFPVSFNDCTGATLAPGATCTIDVAYSAGSITPPSTVKLQITGVPGGFAQVSISGTATG
jgi:hypothetical protein